MQRDCRPLPRGPLSTSTCAPFYAEGSKTLGYEAVEQLGLAYTPPRDCARRLGLDVYQDMAGL